MLIVEEKEGLGLALNEATLLGAEVDREQRVAGVTLSVLTLPSEGPSPSDPRLQLLLHDVSRVAASLRGGRWDDLNAPVQPFELSELLQVVQSFGGCPIYGEEFFDVAEQELLKWNGRFSLDVRLSGQEPQHSLRLFQEGGGLRHLDLCIWFRGIEFRNPDGAVVPVSDVIAGGRRWWDALAQSDPRTTSAGIYLIKPQKL